MLSEKSPPQVFRSHIVKFKIAYSVNIVISINWDYPKIAKISTKQEKPVFNLQCYHKN